MAGNPNILNISKEKGQCEQSYQEKGFCHSYFFEYFNVYPSVLHIEKEEYLKKIRSFHDPILIYVALYFYHNYKIAQEYFKPKENNGRNTFINKSYGKNYNTACAVLNRWLDQQKNIYTNFGRCFYNLRWWNISIEPLWKKLEEYYPGKTCERYDSYYYKEETRENHKDENRFYKQEVEDHVCYNETDNEQSNPTNDNNDSIKENCAKLSILFDLCNKHSLFNRESGTTPKNSNIYCNEPYEKIYYNSMLKAEKYCNCDSLITTISLPISATVFGTIFFTFFLNEFTPIGSILGTRSKNKARLPEHFKEEEEYEEYETYRNNNQNTAREKNIIYYQSMNE